MSTDLLVLEQSLRHDPEPDRLKVRRLHLELLAEDVAAPELLHDPVQLALADRHGLHAVAGPGDQTVACACATFSS